MDGLSIAAAVFELQSVLGAKIEKVHQPEKDVLVLTIKSDRTSKRLLLSASSGRARIHLTNTKKQNPAIAPNFCMVLRKRLIDGRIVGIEQHGMDRCVTLRISAYNELGDKTEFLLIAELLGKHSNLILCNSEFNVIDCIRRVDFTMSPNHSMMPGLRYEYPEIGDKLDPRETAADVIYHVLSENIYVPLDKRLSSSFSGFSPACAKRLLACVKADSDDIRNISAQLSTLFSRFKSGKFEPCVLLNGDNRPTDVFPFVPDGFNNVRAESMCEALDTLYSAVDENEHIKRITASMRKCIHNSIERCERKLSIIESEISDRNELDKLRIYGELLTANIYRLKSGFASASVENYYENPPVTVVIPLDSMKSINENAQSYFKRYKKGLRSLEMGTQQIEETHKELDYLREMEYLVANAADSDVAVLQNELIDGGYMRPKNGMSKKKSVKIVEPYVFRSSENIEILVGRNSRQNDELTFKIARPGYTWLHAKDMPGSHVIIMAESYGEATLEQAALICAYYSKGRMGANVSVDYTQRRFVKKPNGAKPGMVIYTKQKTLTVTPNATLIETLRV